MNIPSPERIFTMVANSVERDRILSAINSMSLEDTIELKEMLGLVLYYSETHIRNLKESE